MIDQQPSAVQAQVRAQFDRQGGGVDAWLRAAGPDEQTAHTILAMLTADGDPARLHVRREGDRLLMTHQTVVLIARRW